MRFRFTLAESLPRLAWHARLRFGEEDIALTHGPWVETRADAFAEGAWDGAFDEFRPDEAITFTGSGGRTTSTGVSFVTATNPLEHVYLARRDHVLHVSNSLPFLMAMSGETPDPGFPFYDDEIRLQANRGVKRSRRSLPTSGGEAIVHECANLRIDRHLEVTRQEKPAAPAPHDFASYEALLSESVGRVLENARHPARLRTYEPIASISTGYDSTCVAALAARHGCKRAITFTGDVPGAPDADDGSALANALGLHVTGLVRCAPVPQPFPEAEFCVCPPSGDRVWLSGEEHLAGRILLTGRGGDGALATTGYVLADLSRPNLGGASLSEFRLRAGTLQLAPLYLAWQHVDQIRAIGRSAALRPWSLGGRYDRPVARRILEEAGAPREGFGMEKRAGAYSYVREPDDLSPLSRADYLDFILELQPSRRLRWRMRALSTLDHARRRGLARLRAHVDGSSDLYRNLLLARRYRSPPGSGFFFHWGFARMSGRYRV